MPSGALTGVIVSTTDHVVGITGSFEANGAPCTRLTTDKDRGVSGASGAAVTIPSGCSRLATNNTSNNGSI